MTPAPIPKICVLALACLRALAPSGRSDRHRRSPLPAPKLVYPRLKNQGSTKRYSTWVDETLNITLRRIAAAAHALRMEERIFHAFSLIGRFALDHLIFGR